MIDKDNIAMDMAELLRLAEVGQKHENAQRLDAEKRVDDDVNAARYAEMLAVAQAAVKVNVPVIAAAVIEAQKAADKAEKKRLNEKGKAALRKAAGFALLGAYVGFFGSFAKDALTDDDETT